MAISIFFFDLDLWPLKCRQITGDIFLEILTQKVGRTHYVAKN